MISYVMSKQNAYKIDKYMNLSACFFGKMSNWVNRLVVIMLIMHARAGHFD